MPEGDTIHRTAETLTRALAGRGLTTLRAPRVTTPMPPAGTRVVDVVARGKHLLVHFDDGHVLHTHLGMGGSWTLRRVGDARRHARSRAGVVLGDREVQAICVDAAVVELLDDPAVARHPVLRRLGPDLCLPDPDIDEALARMAWRAGPGHVLVDLLLDQQVAAGIGNVYANELPFLARVHPGTPIEDVDDATRRQLLVDGARLLRENVRRARRTTVPDAPEGSLWVYRRAGRPCRHCGDTIRSARLGQGARTTAWCPTDQPTRRAPPGAGPGDEGARRA